MTVAQLIELLEDFDQDAQVIGDDDTRFVTVEKAVGVYIRTWGNIDHEEYLKDEVDTIMMIYHGQPEEIIAKMVSSNLAEHEVNCELTVNDRIFLRRYIHEKVAKEQKSDEINELENFKEHLRDLIKQCDNKIAELTKGQTDAS